MAHYLLIMSQMRKNEWEWGFSMSRMRGANEYTLAKRPVLLQFLHKKSLLGSYIPWLLGQIYLIIY